MLKVMLKNWITKEEASVRDRKGRRFVLPRRSFVTPLDEKFVPPEVREDMKLWPEERYVYCAHGICVIDKNEIEPL